MTESPRAALWSSAFRPFYLLGALYAPLLMLAWFGAYAGLWDVPSVGTPLRLWHGHEMIYGFAAAIITGIVFTALPSWAGTAEIRGGPLVLLVLLWLAGRAAFWLAPWLSPLLVAGLDGALFLAAAIMVTPQLLRVENSLYLLLLPILIGLFAGNALYHGGLLAADTVVAALGLRLGIYSIVLLYILKGGVLTPIFTGNVLREQGRGDQARFRLGLETLGVLSVVTLAGVDLLRLPAAWIGAAATAACAVHLYRAVRWQGWKVVNTPLVFVMHLGFLWLIAAFALKALAAFAPAVPEGAWLHAFTVGSLGMMMLGLMTRVTLRHTGRALVLPPAINVAFGLMFLAALLRVAGAWLGSERGLIVASTVLWAASFLTYLGVFGRALVSPSLARETRP